VTTCPFLKEELKDKWKSRCVCACGGAGGRGN